MSSFIHFFFQLLESVSSLAHLDIYRDIACLPKTELKGCVKSKLILAYLFLSTITFATSLVTDDVTIMRYSLRGTLLKSRNANL